MEKRVSYSPLGLAITSLEDAILFYDEKKATGAEERELQIIRAAVIRNFEFTYELAYKMIVRWLFVNRDKEEAAFATKLAHFKMAKEAGLISSTELWNEFNGARNLTSHTYNEDNSVVVFNEALKFIQEAKNLFSRLETE
ncbi:nucleotidyltransferase [Clostridia bacterium]|nr:nucleotidyltransferase [Clostridia bacterium]